MRINKFIAESGVASRRKADELIEDGLVKVNGKICEKGYDVDIGNDHVSVEGKTINTVKTYEYYIMNKPKGYITTVKDDKGRKTVMDLLPDNLTRLFPVGRLDYESEGLLLLTNDGDLTFKLTHPKNEIPKTYLVKTERPISDSDIALLKNGIVIDGEKTNKCKINLVERNKNYSKFNITITEGKNREIRKMIESIGNNVEFLKRTKIGDLKLTGLNRGEYRKLTSEEIDYLLYL